MKALGGGSPMDALFRRSHHGIYSMILFRYDIWS